MKPNRALCLVSILFLSCGRSKVETGSDACDGKDNDGDGFVDEQPLLQTDNVGNSETEIDLDQLNDRDNWGDAGSDPGCGSFTVGLWAGWDWDCSIVYRTQLWSLPDSSLCEDCTYGYFIDATVQEGLAEALGGTECDPADLVDWPMPDHFSSVWAFQPYESDNYPEYQTYETAMYYTFSDHTWVPTSGVYFSDSGRYPYSDWELFDVQKDGKKFEAGSFGF